VLQTKQSGCTCVSPTPPVIQYFVAFQTDKLHNMAAPLVFFWGWIGANWPKQLR